MASLSGDHIGGPVTGGYPTQVGSGGLVWLQRPVDTPRLHIHCLGWSAPALALGIERADEAVLAIANPVDDRWVEPALSIAKDYDYLTITAWSLGFVLASRRLGDISHGRWRGVNGVLQPFAGALDEGQSRQMATQLTAQAQAHFQRGMCGSRANLCAWKALPSHPDRAHSQASLAYLLAIIDEPIPFTAVQWDQICIGTHDRIMNPQVMMTSWASLPGVEVHTQPIGHWVPNMLAHVFASTDEPSSRVAEK